MSRSTARPGLLNIYSYYLTDSMLASLAQDGVLNFTLSCTSGTFWFLKSVSRRTSPGGASLLLPCRACDRSAPGQRAPGRFELQKRGR